MSTFEEAAAAAVVPAKAAFTPQPVNSVKALNFFAIVGKLFFIL